MSSMLKSFGKVILTVFVILYVLLEIFVTICLLNFNDYRVTEFGNNSLIILDNDLGKKYEKNDLLLVSRGDGSEVNIQDDIFFYNPVENYTVNYGEVKAINKVGEGYTYVVDGAHNVYADYFIGKDVKIYKHIGGILKFLESKWGFLMLVVLPTLIAVIYEVYVIIIEIIEIKKEVNDE